MKASEALKQLRAKGSLDEMLGLLMGEPIQRAIESLEREAEREEQERPKVTMADQIHRLNWLSAKLFAGSVLGGKDCDAVECDAAAATLRKLDEEGGKLLYNCEHGCPTLDEVPEQHAEGLRDFIRSLGVEPKP